MIGAGAEAGFSSAIAVLVRVMTSSRSFLILCRSTLSGSACKPDWTVSSWEQTLSIRFGNLDDSRLLGDCIPSTPPLEQPLRCSFYNLRQYRRDQSDRNMVNQIY